jgi:lysozyme family protein
MTTTFDTAFANVVGLEGGYADDPRDRGNWTGGAIGQGKLRGTKYGISAAAFPTLDIANLTLDAAKAIYRAKYWNKIAGDEMPGPIAEAVFDCAVNQGPQAAAEILQDALGVDADGTIGPQTVAAAQRYRNDPSSIVTEIGAQRAYRYALSQGVQEFGLGWMRRVFQVTTKTLAAA